MKTITLDVDGLARLMAAFVAQSQGMDRGQSNAFLIVNLKNYRQAAKKIIDSHGDKEESKIVLS